MRADEALAGEILALAVSVFERGGEKHWWLYAPTSHLLTRALSAIPPSKRGVHVGRMIAFPLPAERTEGFERDWPEFSDLFQPREVTIDRPAGAWDRRISELIDWVTKDREDTRHRAILRLWTLSKKAVLTEAETGRFADAIWAQRTSPSGLPADNSFYPGIFLVLPEPSPGMAAAAFNHDVVQPLLSGDAPLVPHSFESIAYIGRAAEEGQLERPFPPEVALKLIHNILPPTDKELDGSIAEAIFFGLLPVAVLDERAAAELWTRATANDASGAVLFLPYLARNDPSRRNEAVARLRRAMNARDFLIVDYALNAVREWVRMGDRDAVPQPLGTAVASLVAIRREPGLFRAIDVCVDLVERNFLAEEDLQHVLDGLADLVVETDYKNWRRGDFRTATLTYVRANAYRLALALRRHGRRHPSIDAWIAAGSTDPAPEVRHVVME